eukprot:7103826-Pyramimonas_sp.AAC.1
MLANSPPWKRLVSFGQLQSHPTESPAPAPDSPESHQIRSRRESFASAADSADERYGFVQFWANTANAMRNRRKCG